MIKYKILHIPTGKFLYDELYIESYEAAEGVLNRWIFSITTGPLSGRLSYMRVAAPFLYDSFGSGFPRFFIGSHSSIIDEFEIIEISK